MHVIHFRSKHFEADDVCLDNHNVSSIHLKKEGYEPEEAEKPLKIARGRCWTEFLRAADFDKSKFSNSNQTPQFLSICSCFFNEARPA
jgi:hypothetical protein